jgi:WD40 repeat protein
VGHRTGAPSLTVKRGTRSRTPGIAHRALSADGTRLLADNGVGTVSIWEVDTHTTLNLKHTSGDVQSALCTSDDNRVITSGEDSTLRVCDARTGAELLKLDLRAPVTLIATSTDGRSVAGIDQASHAVTVFGCEVMCPVQALLDLVPSRTTRELTTQEQQKYLHAQT